MSRVFLCLDEMTDILLWVSFALQVWSVYSPFHPGTKRRQYRRNSVTVVNLGVFKRTTLESERSDTRY